MMYQNKVAVALKHNGKVLREFGDIVKLPFGSEFTILVKNLNNRRMEFTLHIDGADALEGTKIVVGANSEAEVKRYIRNGNMTEGNAFKFIERNEAIENSPRGIKAEDGLVRVEAWFEVERFTQTYPSFINYYPRWEKVEQPYWYNYYSGIATDQLARGNVISTSSVIRGVATSSTSETQHMNAVASTASVSTKSFSKGFEPTVSAEVNTAGITVPGSKVDQTFTQASWFATEAYSTVIVLKLVGKTEKDEVKKPITVKTKQKCVTCSSINKVTSKFCCKCGTALELI